MLPCPAENFLNGSEKKKGEKAALPYEFMIRKMSKGKVCLLIFTGLKIKIVNI